jgi:type IV fimbrial biogenesis protein FimT
MITISVMAILMAVAAPGFRAMLGSNRAAAQTNELVAALNLARSEAVKRGSPVTVCKCADPAATTPACSTSTGWQAGWLVFTDGNTVGTVDGSDARLRVGQPIGNNVTLTADSNYSNYVTYQPNGSSVGTGGGNNGQLTLCVDGYKRVINISSTGRVQVSAGSC